MAQDGRAVIAAIVAYTVIGFARVDSADSGCLHCGDNVAVSPLNQYFRSIKDEYESAMNIGLGNDRTETDDTVKSCTNMCVTLAQDGLSGNLLEKNLPESISKLSSWLKTFVKDSFTVEEETNSIRRKRQAPDNYYAYEEGIPPEYDMMNVQSDILVDDLVLNAAEQLIGDYAEYEDSVEQLRAMPYPTGGRHYFREHGKSDKPKMRSDCLAKQQQLLNEVLNVLDEITEKAIEHLRGMIREEVEREMTEAALFKTPVWWIISLQQNNLILPFLSKDKLQTEEMMYSTKEPGKMEGKRPYTTDDSAQERTSRASAIAMAMSTPMGQSWYAYQTPNSQSWYPYQNTMPPQNSYPYQNTPTGQQTWYSYSSSPPNQGWYPPESNAQVAMSTPQMGAPPPQTQPEEFTTRKPVMTTPQPTMPSEPVTEMVTPYLPVNQPEHQTGLPQTPPELPDETELPETSPFPVQNTTSRLSEATNPPETSFFTETTAQPETTPMQFEATEFPETTPAPVTTETTLTTSRVAETKMPEGAPKVPEPTFPSVTMPPETTFPEATTESDTFPVSTITVDTETTTQYDVPTTEPAQETTVGVSSRAFKLRSDQVVLPDCSNSSTQNRFLPAILEVFKLRSK